MLIYAFDIETTDLKANFGRMLCASFYPIVVHSQLETLGEVTTFRLDDYADNRDTKGRIDDSELVADVTRFINNETNAIVTWNGKMFDTAFLNARNLYWHQPRAKPQFHMDMMYFARAPFNRIGSARLASVEQFLQLEENKTPLDWNTWQAAAVLDTESMDAVVEHCEQDVKVLAEVYWQLLPCVANVHK